MKRILFLCTGNTCRSPMAEAFLKGLAQEKGLAVEVRSAGISTMDGLPVSANSIHALQQHGIQHKGNSRALNEDVLHWADLILTMTSGHKREVIRRYPAVMEYIFTLKEYAYMDELLQSRLKELESLYSEQQMQQALDQPMDELKRQRIIELERSIPSFDVADPFGGSQSVYDACARELGEAIKKVVDRLIQSSQNELSNDVDKHEG